MHSRPCRDGKGLWIAPRQTAFGLHRHDGIQQCLKRVLGGLGVFRLFAGRNRCFEHHQKVLWRLQGKLQVAAARQRQSFGCGAAFGHGLDHRFGKPVETLGGYGRQQIVFVAKVAIGCVVRYSRAPRHFAQSEALRAGLCDQPQCRVQQALLQVDPMIRPFGCHGLLYNKKMLTGATSKFSLDVDGVNMISYKQHPLDDHWDAIVIGSGIGGLTTAALLSKHAARKVLVLERHYTAGGYTHSFQRPGYSWDVGVHYIGELQDTASPLRAAFDHLTGGALEWAPMPDVYDRIILGGRTFEFPTGLERFRARLKDYFPNEAGAIDRYLAAVQSAQKASQLYFTEKAIPRPIARLAGRFLRAPFLSWASQSTLDVLRGITANDELIALLTAQWGDYGLPPAQSSFGIHAIIAAHYFNGASYPVGGAARIAETITPLIERNGGKVVVSADVEEIIVQSGKATGVKMADGREFRADLVVSDAGARNTFQRLLRQPQPILQDLDRVPGSLAHLSLYIGVKQNARELGLNGTNLWIYPSGDHDANLARFIGDPAAPFPVVYISFPSAKDPAFEGHHPGRATLEAVVFAPYHWFARWEDSRWKHRAAEYDAFKQVLADRIQREVERHVPSVAGKIDRAELSTPLTTRHFMNYAKGEAYGLAATPERFRLRSLTPQTSIRNLYLTGQDVASLGVAGALFGGVITASAVLRRNLMSRVTKPARAAAAAV